MDNTPLAESRDTERLKNAETFAKALKPYLQTCDEASSRSQQTRGRAKDKRICQLNAGFKYCSHLEKGLIQAYEKCKDVLGVLSDDYKLLTNLSDQNKNNEQDSNDSSVQFSFTTPLDFANDNLAYDVCNTTYENNQKNADSSLALVPMADRNNPPLINNSDISIENQNQNENKSQKANDQAKLKEVTNSFNFQSVDTSPILGYNDHYMNENEQATLDENNNDLVNGNTSDESNKPVQSKRSCNENDLEDENSILQSKKTENRANKRQKVLNDSINNLDSSRNNKENTNFTIEKILSSHFETPNTSSATLAAQTKATSSRGSRNISNSLPSMAFSTPTSAKKLDETTASESNLTSNNETSHNTNEVKRHYFLRSTTVRLRNMLNANNNNNKKRSRLVKETPVNVAVKQISKTDSTATSSRSSSLTTTPSVKGADTSLSSHDLNDVTAKVSEDFQC